MGAIKRQYFLSFAVMGAVLPYLSVFLSQRGLGMSQIGVVLSLTGLGIVMSPVLSTALADTRVSGRVLLGVLLAATGGSLAWLSGVSGFWTLLWVHGLFALAFAPITALQDGLYFERRAAREVAGRLSPAYHMVRVYGTFGFIVPSLGLYFLLRAGTVDTGAAIAAAAVCAGVGVANAFSLPGREVGVQEEDVDGLSRKRLPTLAAAKALAEPHALVFCLAMLLLHLAIAAYYGFYPVYLTERIGIGAEWVGLIANLGVVIEIGFMLGFGWLVARLGLRGLMVAGALCMAGRFALLGFAPTVAVAVGTQVLHGVMVLVVHVAPPIYLDGRADPTYRHSIQGLYAVAVYGTGRIVGNLAGGWVAEASLTAVFVWSAGLSVAAAGLFGFAFGDREAEGTGG
ncbi:MAG: MFS transporter [Planctomycetota bacterium]